MQLVRNFHIAFATLTFAVSIAGSARCAQPSPLPIAAYGQLPNVESMRVSPSGERYAYIRITGDSRTLVVKTIKGAPVYLGVIGNRKIRDIEWADDGHVILFEDNAQYLDDFFDLNDFRQAIAINVDKRTIFGVFQGDDKVFPAVYGYYGATKMDGHLYGFFGGITTSKMRGFEPALNAENYVDLYRVDLDRKLDEVMAPSRQRERSWVVDGEGRVIANVEYTERNGNWTLHTGPGGGRDVTTFTDLLGDVGLQGMGPAPEEVIIGKNQPEIWRLDGPEGQKPISLSDQLSINTDVLDTLHDPSSRLLVGLSVSGDRAKQVFVDPILVRRQAAFAKALGGVPQIISWSDDRKRMALFTEGDQDAGTWWLVDGAEVKAIAYAYPAIPDVDVGSTSMIRYAAADGLAMDGVLTLPPGRLGRDLPLVVIPHGGPQAHDELGFDWLAQSFASRGYAVFQPNYRGSDGRGFEFRDAGFGEWGRKMQTDISDGVAELAKRGIIDPKRACIVGASYGGYAALAGVTIQNGLYGFVRSTAPP